MYLVTTLFLAKFDYCFTAEFDLDTYMANTVVFTGSGFALYFPACIFSMLRLGASHGSPRL